MKKNSLFKAISCLLVVAVLFGCSFAYFTDYATEQATGTAGTVALSMDSNINLLDANGMDIINPGDMRDGSFTVTNEGNKSIDVRTTIALTTQSNTGFDLTFSGDGTTQSEYDLYLASDVELVEGKGYMPKDGAQPLQVKSIDQDVITYVLPEYSLNGNSDKYDEVESIDGVNEYSHTYDFVMVMKGGATNEWQNSSVSIDVLVEAKQHENTSAGWEIVAKENVVSGSINQEAVKGENVITENTNQGSGDAEQPNPGDEDNGAITFSLTNSDTDSGIAGVPMKLYKKTDAAINLLDGTEELIGTVYSDKNGTGSFGDLEPGNYVLSSPSLDLDANAENLVIEGTETVNYDYSVSLGESSTLVFKVVDQNGAPVENAYVQFTASGTWDTFVSVETNAEGIAETDVFDGLQGTGACYAQAVYLKDASGRYVPDLKASLVGADDYGEIEFTLGSTEAIEIGAYINNATITVVDQNGAPVENAVLYIPTYNNDGSVWVLDGTDENGQTTITLANGDYEVTIANGYNNNLIAEDFIWVEGETPIDLQCNLVKEQNYTIKIVDENGAVLTNATDFALSNSNDGSDIVAGQLTGGLSDGVWNGKLKVGVQYDVLYVTVNGQQYNTSNFVRTATITPPEEAGAELTIVVDTSTFIN